MPTRWLVCKRYSAVLAAYSEDALPPQAAARIEAHLAACAACRDDLRALRQVSGVLLAHKPVAPEPPAELWQRVHARISPDARPAARPVWRMPVFAASGVGLAAAALFWAFAHPWDAPAPVMTADASMANRTSATAPGARQADVRRGVAGNDAAAVPQTATPGGAGAEPAPVRAPRIAAAAPPSPLVNPAVIAAASSAAAGSDPFLRLDQRNDKPQAAAKRAVKSTRRVPARIAAAPRRAPKKAVTVAWAEPAVPSAVILPRQFAISAKVGEPGQSAAPEESVTNGAANVDSRVASAFKGANAPSAAPQPSHADTDGSAQSELSDSDAAAAATLTGTREVPASASAVARYLSDKRKNSLFRYSQR